MCENVSMAVAELIPLRDLAACCAPLTREAISEQHDNTIVMDWHATIAANPSLLHTDRTHPNFEGIQVYADQLAQTLQTLGPQ
jgi:lysophospholipase L1-like esterase